MTLKIGMPEVLVLFSLFMFEMSFWFSIVSFSLGVLGRIVEYITNYSIEMKKAESINQSVDDLGNAFKDLFNGNKE